MSNEVHFNRVYVASHSAWGWLLLSHALHHQQREGRTFSFAIIYKRRDFSSGILRGLVEKFGGTLILADEYTKMECHISCEEMFLHSYAFKDFDATFLHKICFKNYWLYSDGYRNDFKNQNSKLGKNATGIIYFGWRLYYEKISFFRRDCVIPFSAIRKVHSEILSALLERKGIPIMPVSSSILLLRYWTRSRYQPSEYTRMSDIVLRYLNDGDCSKERPLIIKRDLRVSQAEFNETLEACSDAGFCVYPMAEKLNLTEEECAALPFEVFLPKDYHGDIFTFDSSISVYAAALCKCRVVLPSASFIEDVFGRNESAKLAQDLSRRYRTTVELLQNSAASDCVITLTKKEIGDTSEYRAEWLPERIAYC
jgi:hypothetical protein